MPSDRHRKALLMELRLKPKWIMEERRNRRKVGMLLEMMNTLLKTNARPGLHDAADIC